MSSFFAFLHHLAAFALVAALVLEIVMIKDDLSVKTARKLQFTDAVFGASAGIVLVVGLLSIYPTMEFLSWRKSVKEGRVPVVSEGKLRMIRSVMHWELAGVVVLILCAALMARGVGYLG